MKSTLTLFLALTSVTLAVVCVMQTRKFGGQQGQLASLRSQLEEKAQRIETLQAEQKRSDKQRHELTAQAEELAAQLEARQFAETNLIALAPTNPPPAVSEDGKPEDGKGGLGKMISKMMQDPDTRKFVREQQRMMMDQMYAPLIKKLGLTPEEATQFKNMLSDHAMSAVDSASTMLGGLGSSNQTQAVSTLAAAQKIFDEQVQAFLGDDRYAQYKDYQETVGERTLLNQFKQQAGSDYNLNDQQSEALLTFMKEEQKSVASTTGLPLGQTDNDPAKLQSLFSDGKVDELLQAQETVAQRVYDRARTILSPDQMDTLGRYQTNRMQMMRMGMNMMRSMFKPEQPAGGGAAPGP